MSDTLDVGYVFTCIKRLELRVGVAAALYGMLLILFFVTLRAVVTQYHARSNIGILLLMLFLTFVIPTIIFALTMRNISTQLRPENSLSAFNGCDVDVDPMYLRILFVIQMFILDTYTVYRTWLIHARANKIIIAPAVLSFALFAFIPISAFSFRILPEFYDVVLPISLVLNVLCTTLISRRLIKAQFEALQSSRAMILQFVIVSGGLYSVVLFFLLIGSLGGWGDGVSLVGPIAVSSVGAIAFDLLVLQLALTKALHHHFVPLDEAGLESFELKRTSDPVIDLAI